MEREAGGTRRRRRREKIGESEMKDITRVYYGFRSFTRSSRADGDDKGG
jgi:hypothetical protein